MRTDFPAAFYTSFITWTQIYITHNVIYANFEFSGGWKPGRNWSNEEEKSDNMIFLWYSPMNERRRLVVEVHGSCSVLPLWLFSSCAELQIFSLIVYIKCFINVLRQTCLKTRPTPLRGRPCLFAGDRPSRTRQLAEGRSSFSRPVTCGLTSAKRPCSKCKRLASLCRHSLGMYR